MRILTGVDLRIEGYEWIVDRTARYAIRAGATVDLVFVLAGKETERLAEHMAALDELLGRIPLPVRGRTMCVPGSPVEVLVEKSKGYDALVVGPREPGAIERLFLGSIAARVVRKTGKTAVLIPRGNARDREPKLLTGVDMRGPDPAAVVRQSGMWAAKLGAAADMVYVAPRMPHIANAAVRAQAEKEWQAQHEPLRLQLDGLMAVNVPVEARGKALLAAGEPESALQALSAEYDVVCVGSLPRTGLAGMILGSVAEHVVRHADCDVITLPTGVSPP